MAAAAVRARRRREAYFEADVARAASGIRLTEEERPAFLREHDQYDA